MPHHIGYQHTDSVRTNDRKVVEIPGNARHGRVSCSEANIFEGRNHTGKNCFLNLPGSTHFIRQRDQTTFVRNHSLRNDIPETNYEDQKSIRFEPRVPILHFRMQPSVNRERNKEHNQPSEEYTTIRQARRPIFCQTSHGKYYRDHDYQHRARWQNNPERTRKHHTADCDRSQCAIDHEQPTNRRLPTATIELFKEQKPRNDRGQVYEALDRNPEFRRLSEPETKNRVSDNEDSSVENR